MRITSIGWVFAGMHSRMSCTPAGMPRSARSFCCTPALRFVLPAVPALRERIEALVRDPAALSGAMSMSAAKVFSPPRALRSVSLPPSKSTPAPVPSLQRPGAVLSRAQLEDRLYGWGEEVGSNAVEDVPEKMAA